jgi:hypothetical protein
LSEEGFTLAKRGVGSALPTDDICFFHTAVLLRRCQRGSATLSGPHATALLSQPGPLNQLVKQMD